MSSSNSKRRGKRVRPPSLLESLKRSIAALLPVCRKDNTEALEKLTILLICEANVESGQTGIDNLRRAGDQLVHVSDEYHVSRRPGQSTDAWPGSAEKIAVLEERVRNGQSVYRDGDTCIDGEGDE